VKFEASIDTENVEMHYIDRPVGTTIKIAARTSAGAVLHRLFKGRYAFRYKSRFEILPGGLYLLSDPSVTFLLNNSPVRRDRIWPNCHAALPSHWHRIDYPGFADIQWSYSALVGGEHILGRVACNGIAVGDYSQVMSELSEGLFIRLPAVSIFDPDGQLPLTLRRDAVSSLPFHRELLVDIYHEIVAQALLAEAKYPDSGIPRSDHIAVYGLDAAQYICTSKGFTLQDGWILQELRVKAVAMFAYFNKDAIFPVPQEEDVAWVHYPNQTHFTFGESDKFIRRIFDYAFFKEVVPWSFPISGLRLTCPSELADRWIQKLPKYLNRQIFKATSPVRDWSFLTYGACGEAVLPTDKITAQARKKAHDFEGPLLIEIYRDCNRRLAISPAGEVFWNELKSLVLPYSPVDRRALISTAGARLRSFIDQGTFPSVLDEAIAQAAPAS
jgi:hypothetical protein